MNKTSGDGGISAELFQSLKGDAVEVLHSICQQTGNSAVATGLEKINFQTNPKEDQCKECSNYCTIALLSHASKVMLNILQGFNSKETENFHMFKLAEELEIKLPTSAAS